MITNQNFLGGGGMPNNKPSVRGVWIFSGTAQCYQPVSRRIRVEIFEIKINVCGLTIPQISGARQ